MLNFKTLMIEINNSCNLKCIYCYVKKGGEKIKLNDAKKAIDFVFECEGRKKDIIFTGGEPLLEKKLLKKIVNYANKKSLECKKSVFIGLATNGTLIEESDIEFFNKSNIEVVISIDGLKKTHDSNRPLKNNKSSFNILMGKIYLYKKIKNLRIKMTIMPDNHHIYKDTLFLNRIMLFKRIDFQPVIRYYWNNRQIKLFATQMKKIVEYYKKNKEKIEIKYIENELNQENNYPKICPMGSKEICIDVKGNFYPCQHFLNLSKESKKKFLIGNAKIGVNLNRLNEIMNFNVNNIINKKCEKCGIKEKCNRICLKYNFEGTKTSKKSIELNCRLDEAMIKTIH